MCFYDCRYLTGGWHLLVYGYFFNQLKIKIFLTYLLTLKDVELDFERHLVTIPSCWSWCCKQIFRRKYNRVIIMWIALKLISKIFPDSSRDVPSYWLIFLEISQSTFFIHASLFDLFTDNINLLDPWLYWRILWIELCPSVHPSFYNAFFSGLAYYFFSDFLV